MGRIKSKSLIDRIVKAVDDGTYDRLKAQPYKPKPQKPLRYMANIDTHPGAPQYDDDYGERLTQTYADELQAEWLKNLK